MKVKRRVPRRVHHEAHFTASATVRDIVLGMSDGLTVPFALAAGISGAIAASHLVVTSGVAELAAGGISMGLGGYLAARSEIEHYASEERREIEETENMPEEERHEIEVIFRSYGMSGENLQNAVDAITSNRKRWVDFMMKYELGLDKPNEREAPRSAATIGGSYVVGGIVPLLPYFFIANSGRALIVSVIVTAIALAVFGAVKGRFTGVSAIRSALQTLAIGGLAAAVAFAVARFVAGAPG